jgi:UDP-glucose 4-epimerase
MIIVIGASGDIGTYLVDELILQKRDVFVTTLKQRPEQFYKNKNVMYSKLDISNENDFRNLPKKDIEAVILLGGLLPANLIEYNPKFYKDYIDVNIHGTLNVLEYCRKNNAKKIIFANSHSDVSQLWNCEKAITEEDRHKINFKGDHAVYIITKITAMDLIEHYHQEYGVQGVSLRLPAVYAYSPRTGLYINGKFIKAGFNIFIEKSMASEPIEIWGNPKKGKDMVYVKDVVSAFIGAVDSGNAHGLYNVATGISTSLEDEAKGIIEVFSPTGRPSEVFYNPQKPDTLSYLYDISKAKRDLGYVVKYPYKKLLEDFKLEMNRRPTRFS